MKCRNKTCYWYNDAANLNCIKHDVDAFYHEFVKFCMSRKADEAKRKVLRQCIADLDNILVRKADIKQRLKEVLK